MSEFKNHNFALIPTGIRGLERITNSLKITDKLLSEREIESVIIGEQEWMLKNLDVSRFRNGDPIPEAQDDEEWERAGKDGRPAWCYYDNDPESGKVYGKLYNWYAVNDPRGLAPNKWRIPNNEDFEALVFFLGGWEFAGQKLKSDVEPPPIPSLTSIPQIKRKPTSSQATLRIFEVQEKLNRILEKKWEKRRQFRKGTNESGFLGRLAGFRHSIPTHDTWLSSGIEDCSFFWSDSNGPDDEAWVLLIGSTCDDAGTSTGSKSWGFSVRCISED